MSKSDTTKHRNFVYHDPVLQNYLSRNTHGSLLHESPKLGKDPVNTRPYTMVWKLESWTLLSNRAHERLKP